MLLGERELAAELELLLEPFADRMVVSARGLLCMGSVAGALGASPTFEAIRGSQPTGTCARSSRRSAQARSSGQCTTAFGSAGP